MSYRLDRFDTAQDRADFIASLKKHPTSIAAIVWAYTQLAEYGEPNPETGEVELIAPAETDPGYWLLIADQEAASPLVLPEGIVGLNRLFAGMETPILS